MRGWGEGAERYLIDQMDPLIDKVTLGLKEQEHVSIENVRQLFGMMVLCGMRKRGTRFSASIAL